MAVTSDAVIRDALSLPATERAAVAAELLASLDEGPFDDPAEVEAAWAAELERRAQRAASGEDLGEAWETVEARLRANLRS